MWRIALAVVALTVALRAQSVERPRFESAALKASNGTPDRKGLRFQPDGQVVAIGLTLRELVAGAYSVPLTLMNLRIADGPAWMDTQRFDIIAKAPNASPQTRLLMMQSFLDDRFKLIIRDELRDLPVYALMVLRIDRLGPMLRPSTVDCAAARAAGPPPGGTLPQCVVRVSPGLIDGEGVTLDMLMSNGLARYVDDRPIVNRTGLDGRFDFRLEWAPTGRGGVPAAALDGPSLFTALQEQLGLKLQPQRAMVGVFVVARAELPELD